MPFELQGINFTSSYHSGDKQENLWEGMESHVFMPSQASSVKSSLSSCSNISASPLLGRLLLELWDLMALSYCSLLTSVLGKSMEKAETAPTELQHTRHAARKWSVACTEFTRRPRLSCPRLTMPSFCVDFSEALRGTKNLIGLEPGDSRGEKPLEEQVRLKGCTREALGNW